MGAKLSFRYDRDADILHIDKRLPYPEQESEELGDEVIARLNPKTGEIENLVVLFFSTRLFHTQNFSISADWSKGDSGRSARAKVAVASAALCSPASLNL